VGRGATLAPTANILFPSGVVLSGRTLYAPSIGIALLAGAAAARVVQLPATFRYAAVVAGVSWSVVSAALTLRESVVWRDPDAVGRAMLARQPGSYRSHVYVAEVARLRGDTQVALAHYRTALGLFPRDAYQLYSAASTALASGDTTAGAAWLAGAVELAPGHWMARTRSVKLALARGDTTHARALLDEGLRLLPYQRTWRSWRDALSESKAEPGSPTTGID
jgi:tetratricopeptide (TPR) repeat protein